MTNHHRVSWSQFLVLNPVAPFPAGQAWVQRQAGGGSTPRTRRPSGRERKWPPAHSPEQLGPRFWCAPFFDCWRPNTMTSLLLFGLIPVIARLSCGNPSLRRVPAPGTYLVQRQPALGQKARQGDLDSTWSVWDWAASGRHVVSLRETGPLVHPWDVFIVHLLPRSQRCPVLGPKVTSKRFPVARPSPWIRLDS